MSVLDIQKHNDITHDILRERQEQEIDSIFPTDYNFTIAMDPSTFDDVLSDESTITIKHDYKCYCWKNNRRSEIIEVEGENGCITNKDCIQGLIDAGFNPKCSHRFLERFQPRDGNFTIIMGS